MPIKKADLPKSYEDLTNPKWKGKLGIEAADYDWFSAVVGELGEEKGLKLFRDIVAKNGLSMRKGHTLLANLVVSGEVPLSLTTYLYKVLQLKNDGAPIDWFVLPPEVARSQGTGMARKAPHPHAAVLFMDFLLVGRTDDPRQARFHPDQREGQAAAGGHAAQVRRSREAARPERQVGKTVTRTSSSIRRAEPRLAKETPHG